MNNTLIFLRHGETQKDPNIPVSKWILTEEGMKSAENLAQLGVFNDVDVVISSGEKKAYQTAEPFADKLNKEIVCFDDLNEINRDKGRIMSKEDYNQMKVKIFEDLDYTSHGWETSNHALSRFKDMVNKIDNMYDNKKILITSHGTVMSLFFSYLGNQLDNIFPRWKSLGFCDYGVVKNNKIIKDIV